MRFSEAISTARRSFVAMGFPILVTRETKHATSVLDTIIETV